MYFAALSLLAGWALCTRGAPATSLANTVHRLEDHAADDINQQPDYPMAALVPFASRGSIAPGTTRHLTEQAVRILEHIRNHPDEPLDYNAVRTLAQCGHLYIVSDRLHGGCLLHDEALSDALRYKDWPLARWLAAHGAKIPWFTLSFFDDNYDLLQSGSGAEFLEERDIGWADVLQALDSWSVKWAVWALGRVPLEGPDCNGETADGEMRYRLIRRACYHKDVLELLLSMPFAQSIDARAAAIIAANGRHNVLEKQMLSGVPLPIDTTIMTDMCAEAGQWEAFKWAVEAHDAPVGWSSCLMLIMDANKPFLFLYLLLRNIVDSFSARSRMRSPVLMDALDAVMSEDEDLMRDIY